MPLSIEQLKEKIDKIQQLLDDPQPGMFTWHGFLNDRMNELCYLWRTR